MADCSIEISAAYGHRLLPARASPPHHQARGVRDAADQQQAADGIFPPKSPRLHAVIDDMAWAIAQRGRAREDGRVNYFYLLARHRMPVGRCLTPPLRPSRGVSD